MIWGYEVAAPVFDATQHFFERWFSPTGSLFAMWALAAVIWLSYQAAYEWAARTFFQPYYPSLDLPPSWPSLLFKFAALAPVVWVVLVGIQWATRDIPNFSLLGALGLFGVLMAFIFAVVLTSGLIRLAMAVIGVTAVLSVDVWYFQPDRFTPFARFFEAMLWASAVAVIYLLYRLTHRSRPSLTRPERTPSRSGWPPLPSPPVADTFGDAQLADPQRHGRSMAEILGGAKGLWFGKLVNRDQDASYSGDRHLLTVAPNRTGKGTCTIIPNILMDTDHSIICIDPKGQNAAVTARARRSGGRSVYCLNPFGEHRSAPWNLPMHGFNPLAHMSIDDPNVEADVAALAEAIIVTESQTQPYFENSARDLIEVLILHALETKGRDASLLDMRAWLGLPMTAPEGEPSFLGVIVAMKNSPHPFISEMSARFLSDTKSVGEIVQSATNQTKFLSHRAVAACLSGNDFQMLDFKQRQATLYVILPERYLDAYSRFLRLVVVSALNALRSRPGGVKTILMMDEFARLGSLKAVEQAVGSSAGFNVQLWPFIQDLNQLQHLYPKRWDSFIANAGVVQWFTPNDQTTAAYLSQRIGKTTVLNSTFNQSTTLGEGRNPGGPSTSGSRSSSSNENEVAVDFLSASDMYDMPKDLQILTLAGLKYPVCCSREPYYSMAHVGDAIRNACDPDPFHA